MTRTPEGLDRPDGKTATRVHVVGGPGSGKSTLALRIGERYGLPIHHLDYVYRIGGGHGPLRSPVERDRWTAEIVSQPAWITEGVHLGWTQPLVDGADLVVWLDGVDWLTASRRILRRFTVGGTQGLREPRPGGLSHRVRGYGGHLIALAGALRETRNYYRSTRGTPNLPETRAATAERLAHRAGRVIHCRTDADVRRLMDLLSLGS